MACTWINTYHTVKSLTIELNNCWVTNMFCVLISYDILQSVYTMWHYDVEKCRYCNSKSRIFVQIRTQNGVFFSRYVMGGQVVADTNQSGIVDVHQTMRDGFLKVTFNRTWRDNQDIFSQGRTRFSLFQRSVRDPNSELVLLGNQTYNLNCSGKRLYIYVYWYGRFLDAYK